MGIISRFFWRLNCKGAFARAAKRVKAQYPRDYNLMQPLFMANSLEYVKSELWDEATRHHDIMRYLSIVNEEYELALKKFYHPLHSNSMDDTINDLFKD